MKTTGLDLISAHAEGYYTVYRLDRAALESKSRALFSSQDLSAATTEVDLDATPELKPLEDECRQKLATCLARGKSLFQPNLRLALVLRLRDERPFADVDALRGQIDMDCQRARDLFRRISL